jgi:hypothetical protein
LHIQSAPTVSTEINFEGHINFSKSNANEYAMSQSFAQFGKTLTLKKKRKTCDEKTLLFFMVACRDVTIYV